MTLAHDVRGSNPFMPAIQFFILEEQVEELLYLQKQLESIKETDNVSLDLLDEINDTLTYALGWCHGWIAGKNNN